MEPKENHTMAVGLPLQIRTPLFPSLIVWVVLKGKVTIELC